LEKEDEKAGTQNIPPEKQMGFAGGLSGHHPIRHHELTVLPGMVGRSWFVPDLEFQSFALIHFGIRSALDPANSGHAAMEYKGIGTGGSRTIFNCQDPYSIQAKKCCQSASASVLKRFNAGHAF
jgi:hypothetical protein